MSLERQVEVECPKCHRDQVVTVWESINSDVSPEARTALLNGKINVFECMDCGLQSLLSVPLMYHDMARRFVVRYFPFEAVKDDDFLERFDADGHDGSVEASLVSFGLTDDDSGMSYFLQGHTVFDMSELVRYVIFRELVHDRSVGSR